MRIRVYTCRICAHSHQLDYGQLPTCHAIENFIPEWLDVSPHVVTDCVLVHCEFHGVDESRIAGYRVCRACNHSYPTPDALLAEVAKLPRNPNNDFIMFGPAASEVRLCPLCSGLLRDPSPKPKVRLFERLRSRH